MVQGFKNFVLRGNVVDLAVGVVVGGAFGGLVTALVKNLITPLIGAFGGQPDFSALYFTINSSKFMYGEFLNALLSFIIITAVIYFFVVVPMTKLMATFMPPVKAAATTKVCPECLSDIPEKAHKCKFCASTQK